MLKHKRAAKCPFLEKFLRQSVVQAGESNFLSSAEIFDEYRRVISMWTEEDSAHGQTEHLMKKGSFFMVSIKSYLFSPLTNLQYC